jgi:2-keto-4-pentenoate hydratase/2-oxohepta-3-ene-1,7-dioic acid hydratase in catechol pathway
VKLPGLPELSLGTVYCIGRNYAEHARELGNAVPEEPVVFLKPQSAVALPGSPIRLPAVSKRVDHETEIVIAIGKSGKNVFAGDALALVAGYAVGIDVTARDLQEAAKKKALPWAVAKGFDTFAPISEFVPADRVAEPFELGVTLEVNGQLRQTGKASGMIFPVDALIAYLSGIFTLAPGDLIFTGTPPGVGPLVAGDRLVARLIEGAGESLALLKTSCIS